MKNLQKEKETLPDKEGYARMKDVKNAFLYCIREKEKCQEKDCKNMF